MSAVRAEFRCLANAGARRLVWLLLCLPGFAGAQDYGEELMDDYGCYTCHAYAQVAIGPSLAAIAERYADNPEVVPELARRIREGTSGAWGDDMMGPHLNISIAEAEDLARYILGFATD